MSRRIAARERFWWRGWEFKQSLATSTEVHWEMRHSKIRVRVTYRDIQDPETPPEYTAVIHFQGLEEGQGHHQGGSGIGPQLDIALSNAEEDFIRKCAHAARLSAELRRGKPEDS